MEFEALTVDIDGEVATITLNRPSQRNALNRRMRDELRYFLSDVAPSVKVAVVTGAGDVFCAGMDLKEPIGRGEGEDQWGFFQRLFNSSTIFIGALNGPVVGAGLTFLTAFDLAIADPKAVFALPQVKIGIFGGVAATMLHLYVPKKVIAEMSLTGIPLSAERAKEVGMINSISAPGAYLDEAKALATHIAQFDQNVLRVGKHVIQNLPVDHQQRDQAVKVVRDGTIQHMPQTEDRVLDTPYGGKR